MDIKVVLWDIDGTLLDFKKAESCALRESFKKLELGECGDESVSIYSEINTKHWESLERGEISKAQVLEGRFKEFLTYMGMDISLALTLNRTYEGFLSRFIFYNDGALNVLKSLHGKVRQYAVTNGAKQVQREKLERSMFNRYLDGAFISDEIGFEKPMKGFFDAVFDSIGDYRKDEIMIIGDSLTSDIKGGRDAGIITCRYNPQGKPYGEIKPDLEIDDLKKVPELIGNGCE